MQDKLKKLSSIPSAIVGDVLERLHGIYGLTRYDQGKPLVGTAITVKTRPGDNLALYKALEGAKAGDVLVVDGGGAIENALVGENLLEYAQKRGVVGFVIFGAIRDVDAFVADEGFCCFARGVNQKGPYKDGPGRVNLPVAIAGQVVMPGDILLGDNDGIINFAPEMLDMVLSKSAERIAMEDGIRTEIRTGAVQQSWIEKVMKVSGSKVV